ncbi:hypothetical protein FIBSPDRAFT_744386 [Athelia psychrophila]|uniref:Uncharacterized protein n=1 Tax=Athelia psychrophila TaxID=1759441 RepID=A0A166HQ97_9AGAM|nr:hypothetical protein FIBSPDRAFT_744386 [Fibularhizoctonia sp. CBS 109695]
MQFFKSAVVAVVAFTAVAVAAPGGGHGECKPLLQSCAVNSECCGDLCVAGVCSICRLILNIILNRPRQLCL